MQSETRYYVCKHSLPSRRVEFISVSLCSRGVGGREAERAERELWGSKERKKIQDSIDGEEQHRDALIIKIIVKCLQHLYP